jgi:hypothetical protein
MKEQPPQGGWPLNSRKTTLNVQVAGWFFYVELLTKMQKQM